jgi:hypothetical protein
VLRVLVDRPSMVEPTVGGFSAAERVPFRVCLHEDAALARIRES